MSIYSYCPMVNFSVIQTPSPTDTQIFVPANPTSLPISFGVIRPTGPNYVAVPIIGTNSYCDMPVDIMGPVFPILS